MPQILKILWVVVFLPNSVLILLIMSLDYQHNSTLRLEQKQQKQECKSGMFEYIVQKLVYTTISDNFVYSTLTHPMYVYMCPHPRERTILQDCSCQAVMT